MPISSYARKLAPPGDEPYCRVVWKGPASYTRVTAGSPPTGGDPIVAATFGVNRIVYIQANTSYTGNFMILPIRATDSSWSLKWVSLVTATVGGQSQTAFTEAAAGTNLSAELAKILVNTLSG